MLQVQTPFGALTLPPWSLGTFSTAGVDSVSVQSGLTRHSCLLRKWGGQG